MPFGYLVGVLVTAAAVALSLGPRPTRGPRGGPAFVIASVANELPFLVLYWLAADTVLAAIDGDVASPLGAVALALAVCTAAGSAVVIRLAARAGPALEVALTTGLGAEWQDLVIQPRIRRRLGRALVAPLRIPARGVRRERDISYVPAGRQNRLDVYRSRSGPVGRPVLVYFHPGGFFSGGKSRESRALFDRMVGAGWVCISANYRLSGAGEFPNNLIDAKRVIVWIRAHAAEYGADPSSLVVCGGSAGAHLGAMCALTAGDPAFQPGFAAADTSVSAAIGFYGYYGSAPGSGAAASDPAAYARPDAPPFLVIHGSRDPMIAAVNAQRFADQLRAVSNQPVMYAELPGGQHNFDRFPSMRCFAVVDAVQAFATWVRATSAAAPD